MSFQNDSSMYAKYKYIYTHMYMVTAYDSFDDCIFLRQNMSYLFCIRTRQGVMFL